MKYNYVMPTIVFVLADGSRRPLEIPVGTSLMMGAMRNNLPGIDAECGGALSCATCHIYLDPDRLSEVQPADESENEMLEAVAAPRQAGSRLGCQLSVTAQMDGMIVTVPGRQS